MYGVSPVYDIRYMVVIIENITIICVFSLITCNWRIHQQNGIRERSNRASHLLMRWKIQLLATHIWWEHSPLDSHVSELFQLFGVNWVSPLSMSSQLKASNPSFAELFPLIRLEAPLAVTAPPQRRSLRSPPQGIETSGGTHDTKQIVDVTIRTRNLWVFLVSGNFMVEWDFDEILPANIGDLQDFNACLLGFNLQTWAVSKRRCSTIFSIQNWNLNVFASDWQDQSGLFYIQARFVLIPKSDHLKCESRICSAPKSVAFPLWIVSSYPKLHEFWQQTQGFNQGRWRLGPWVRGTSSWPTREYLWKIIWFHSMGRMLHRKLQQNTSIDRPLFSHDIHIISPWYPILPHFFLAKPWQNRVINHFPAGRMVASTFFLNSVVVEASVLSNGGCRENHGFSPPNMVVSCRFSHHPIHGQ